MIRDWRTEQDKPNQDPLGRALGRLLDTSEDRSSETLNAAWHACAFACVLVEAAGAAALLRSTFAVGAAQQSQIGSFLGSACNAAAGAVPPGKWVRFRRALRLLMEQGPPLEQPPALGDPDAGDAVDPDVGDVVDPGAKRARQGPGAGSPYFLDRRLAVLLDADAVPTFPLPPGPPPPFLCDADRLEARVLGELTEEAWEGLLAWTGKAVWESTVGTSASIRAAMDRCWAAVEEARVVDRDPETGALTTVGLPGAGEDDADCRTWAATPEAMRKVRVSVATLARCLRASGFRVLAGRTWYRARVLGPDGEENRWFNVDGIVQETRSPGRVFLWDYTRKHHDGPVVPLRKRRLCVVRLQQLGDAATLFDDERMRCGNNAGFLVTHLCGCEFQHDFVFATERGPRPGL